MIKSVMIVAEDFLNTSKLFDKVVGTKRSNRDKLSISCDYLCHVCDLSYSDSVFQ